MTTICVAWREFIKWTREGNSEALSHFKRAIELDPNFASAFGMAARCYSQRIGFAWVIDRRQEVADAERLARRAGELGKDDAVALSAAGYALVIVVGDIDDGAALIDRALVLNPNLAWAWLSSGFARISLGEPEVAIEHVARAMRLSPQDPQMFAMEIAIAAAHLFAGRPDQALSWAEKAVQERPNFFVGDMRRRGQRRSRGEAGASGESHGALASAQSSAADFQSQGHAALPATGTSDQTRRRAANSRTAGMIPASIRACGTDNCVRTARVEFCNTFTRRADVALLSLFVREVPAWEPGSGAEYKK